MAKIAINLKEGTIAPSEVIVGIDLGTTNSLVAYMVDGSPVTVKSAEGKSALVPSVIYFAEDGGIVVGDQAKELLIESPERTIFSVKRLMGQRYDDLLSHKEFFSYHIIDNDTEGLVKVEIEGRYYNPIELSAHILRYLKQRIEDKLQMQVTKAVITVPAYFNDAQRQATRDAGKLAGLDVLRIVNEPTAASLAYGISRNSDVPKLIAVYDLGGGTFDISILRLDQGIYEVLATNGDTFLGGDDIDQAIVAHWKNNAAFDKTLLSEDKSIRQSLRLLAEEAKKTLSSQEKFTGTISKVEVHLDKNTFEELIKPIIDRTLQSCRKALADAGLKADQLDHILLVGGSTRIPYLKKQVSAFFGKKADDSLDPDQVVALGAAIQADILAGNQREMLLLDITPLSLGIETVGGLMDVILPRNSKIPVSQARNYTTSIDGQKNLKISVFQGERDLVENNRKLGEFTLKSIPPMPAGIPKIEISFIIDADGILKVRAKELRSGLSQEIEIRSAYGISEEEMGKMLLDSLEHAQEDIAEKALREAVNEANHVILSTEKFMQHNKSIFDQEELDQLNKLNLQLKKAITSSDKNQIERSMEELNTFAEPLAHYALDHQISQAMKGKRIGS